MSNYVPVHVTDAGGQTFSIEGCRTVGELKESILEHTVRTSQQKHDDGTSRVDRTGKGQWTNKILAVNQSTRAHRYRTRLSVRVACMVLGCWWFA